MERSLKTVLLIGMLAFALLSALKPIGDPDFWWHLRTGEYILHHGFPDRDPFAYTNPNIAEPRERVIISGYWLAQILYYAAFSAAGAGGIILLRAIVVALMYWSVLGRMKKFVADRTVMLLVLCLSLLSFFSYFKPERPQTFSFLFFSVLLGMIESGGPGKRRSWLIVPLMVLWANMHGGVIVGDAVLGLFAVFFSIGQRGDLKKALPVLLWAGAGIAASLLNPNTYHLFTVAFAMQNQVFSRFITEYFSSYAAFTENGDVQVVFYWILLALTIASLFFSKGRPLWRTAVVLFVGSISFLYIRNIAFLSVGLAPLAAVGLEGLLKLSAPRRLPSGLARLTAVVLLLISLWHYSKEAVAEGSMRREVDDYYPVSATDFIRSAGISGNMFNSYGWGGYLIWRLYPDYQVFIDGRGIYESIFTQYLIIARGETDLVAGLPAWKASLDAFQVDFVIMPDYEPITGQLQPLMLKLMREEKWCPVYIDTAAFIFVKDSSVNHDIIARYGCNKQLFKEKLLRTLLYRSAAAPDFRIYIAIGESLWYLGRYEEAEQAYGRSLQLAPGNATALSDLKALHDYLASQRTRAH
ncbi:MAG: tetratricopeptide repeat protein [Nitrospiraceae bacterium]|nr:tetratricopeptide repeat protein [Nitrospiraceae bacterium]